MKAASDVHLNNLSRDAEGCVYFDGLGSHMSCARNCGVDGPEHWTYAKSSCLHEGRGSS